jgi:Flp pilus assembly protein TadD
MSRRRSKGARRKAGRAAGEDVTPPAAEDDAQGDLLADIDAGEAELSPEARRTEPSEASGPEADDATGPEPEETGERGDDPDRFVPEHFPRLEGERIQRAGDLVSDGRPLEAIEVYLEVLLDNPEHLTARHNLGILYDELGRHAEAIEVLEAARDLEPDNSEVLANLGAALAAVGRFEAAAEHIKRAARLDPESLSVRANLAILAFRRGLYEVAETELRWVCERDPSHGTAHFYRGEALNRMGRVDEALDTLEKTRKLQPWNHRIFHTMGMLYDKKHEPQLAAEMYRRAREATRR